MSRTKRSGWGGGPMLYQVCPNCGKKKALYDPLPYSSSAFKCTSCKKRFHSTDLIWKTFK
jgi:DNA-directed RNA polymerase subunit RPC12/RpoP